MFVVWDVKGVDNTRHSLFVKAKGDLKVLPQGQTIKVRYVFKQTM